MASVAVGISCMGLLGEKQGYVPYPTGPSQQALAFPRSLRIYRLNNAPRYIKYL